MADHAVFESTPAATMSYPDPQERRPPALSANFPGILREEVMRRTVFLCLLALAVLAVAACNNSPAGPSATTPTAKRPYSPPPAPDTSQVDAWTKSLVGTWQATKAEGTNYWDPSVRRDLVAEGGTVTLVLEMTPTGQNFTVTLTMPGEAPRINYGTWHCWNNGGRAQIDFWPGWIPKEDLEYGDGMGMYFALNDNTLTLTDGGGRFLRYDFGWHDGGGHDWAKLELVLTRAGG
jgi:hypothetical protein